MNRRRWMMSAVAVLSLVAGSSLYAAKPFAVEIISEQRLFNITADGQLDLETEIFEGIGIAEWFFKKGVFTIELQYGGTVENLSGKKFKTTKIEDFGDALDFGEGVVIEKINYSVSKTGQAIMTLRVSYQESY